MSAQRKTGLASFECGSGNTMTIEFPNVKGKRPFRVLIEPKSSYIDNLTVGFDEIPKERIVKSDYEILKKEYTTVNGNTLTNEDFLQSDKDYIPNWVSMRTGEENQVEFELNWKSKGKAEEYTKVAFEEHSDFNIEPLNLKNEEGEMVETVTITCKNNNNSPAVLKIIADENLVGAINIFYPTPKAVNVKWAIAEFNELDTEVIRRDFRADILREYFRKALKSALIDVTIENERAYQIDIPTLETNRITSTATEEEKSKDKVIKRYINRMRTHMDGTKKVKCTETHEGGFASNLYYVGRANNNLNNNDTVILILTNLQCSSVDDEGRAKYVNGFTLTGQGISVMALGNRDSKPRVEIPHEVMHAICLHHTFDIDSGFKIKQGTTNNYMDYENTKKNLYKWQWKKLHEADYTN